MCMQESGPAVGQELGTAWAFRNHTSARAERIVRTSIATKPEVDVWRPAVEWGQEGGGTRGGEDTKTGMMSGW